jgi:hypothetical protein
MIEEIDDSGGLFMKYLMLPVPKVIETSSDNINNKIDIILWVKLLVGFIYANV